MANSGLLRSINIIPKNVVWSPGYISSTDGSIINQSATTKEVYTAFDYEAQTPRRLVAIGRYRVPDAAWVGIGTYKADGTFISRPSNNMTPFKVGDYYYWITTTYLALDDTTEKVKVSFRTYGEADIMIFDTFDFMSLCLSDGIINHATT